MSALFIACQNGHLEVIKKIHKLGKAVENEHHLESQSHVECMYIVILLGVCDFKFKRKSDGESCFYIACSKGYAHVVEFLLQVEVSPLVPRTLPPLLMSSTVSLLLLLSSVTSQELSRRCQ